MRLLLMLLLVSPLQTRAGECEDDFAQCQDDCMVQFGGSIREEMKSKFVKCVRKCGRTSSNCNERNTETKVNHLNEGALDKSPGSRAIDEDGLPILNKRPSDDRHSTGDDLRDDLPRVASTKAKPERAPKTKAKKPPRDEVRDDEVVKSERTKLKTDPDSEPPPPAKKAEAPPEPAPPVVNQKVEEPKPPPKKEEDHDDLRNY